ncbi:hypothetical protein [Acetobacter okinawensis]|uniref:hypothetical protein n=1 Tax=Acetobacter okinawensis TaxID=1076594 RepID=UPI0004714F22|nr:hypothetical protein [Acetobacter okinawensis]
MSGDFVTAGALGGIRGSLRRVANDLEQQNRTVSALAQQTQVANHWQTTAFNLQKQLAEWKAWGKKNLEYLGEEEQVSADLRQQLAQAQEALRAEKKLRNDEFNEGVKQHNKLVRKSNRLVGCLNAIKAQPGNAVALIAALEAELNGQKA